MASTSQKTKSNKLSNKIINFIIAISLIIFLVTTAEIIGTLLEGDEESTTVENVSKSNATLLNDKVLQLITFSSKEEYQTLQNYFIDKMDTPLYQEYFSADPSSILSREVSVKFNPTGIQINNNKEFVFKTEVYMASNNNLIELIVFVTVTNGVVSDIEVY